VEHCSLIFLPAFPSPHNCIYWCPQSHTRLFFLNKTHSPSFVFLSFLHLFSSYSHRFLFMAGRYTPPRSLSQRRTSLRESGDDDIVPRIVPRSVPRPLSSIPPRTSSSNGGAKNIPPSSHPKPLPTPNKTNSPLPANLLPSAPASPPTPAPSPTPHYRPSSWESLDDDEEDALLLSARIHFSSLSGSQKQKFLVDILNLCDNQQLSFVSSFVGPRLRKDPFQCFPIELCLRVC
jgi:F-box and WD-40 domain protein CDC4